MREIRTLEEAREVSAIRLTDKRRYAKVGDLFRLSPYKDVILWGRLVKQGCFFGQDFRANLVYIYDVISKSRPEASALKPTNLIIGPAVVNNLGWLRGYWEIVESGPLGPDDVLPRHLFVRYGLPGTTQHNALVDENGQVVPDSGVDRSRLGGAGFSNFNYIDCLVHGILEDRGVIPRAS